MVGQELGWGQEGLGGEEWGPLQPPCPLCPPFLLSCEWEPKKQTRTRILEQEARGRRPRRQGQGGAGFRACAGRGREGRETEEQGTARRPGEPSGAGARGQDGRGRTESYPEDLRGHSPE